MAPISPFKGPSLRNPEPKTLNPIESIGIPALSRCFCRRRDSEDESSVDGGQEEEAMWGCWNFLGALDIVRVLLRGSRTGKTQVS